MKDITQLHQSKTFSIKPFEEKRIDLALQKLAPPPQTLLYGKVIYGKKAIVGATVEVLSLDFNPLYHTITNFNGVYEVKKILKPGKYKLVASAKGYTISPVMTFQINSKLHIDLEIKKEPLKKGGTLYGIIVDSVTQKPLPKVEISLQSKKDPACYTSVISNQNGQYLISALPPGEYFLRANLLGYQPSMEVIILIDEGQFVKSDLFLTPDPVISLGTISGIVENFHSYKEAIVALYKIENNNEILVQLKSLTSNFYFFTNIEPGTYMVTIWNKNFPLNKFQKKHELR